MDHKDYCSWTDEGNNTWSFGVCGVQMRVEGTRWDAGLPGGLHVKGTAGSTDLAKQWAFDEFVRFAIKQLVAHRVNLPPDPPA